MPPAKVEKSDDFRENSAGDKKEIHGINLSVSDMYSTAGRARFTQPEYENSEKNPLKGQWKIHIVLACQLFEQEGPCRDTLPVAAFQAAQEYPVSELAQATAFYFIYLQYSYAGCIYFSRVTKKTYPLRNNLGKDLDLAKTSGLTFYT